MAISRFITSQYSSEQFVESAGAILFRLSTKEICLLHLLQSDEYVLAKGRRNCQESTQQTAVRELMEETGYRCRLLPVTISTRAPPAIETEQMADVPRTLSNITGPFFLQIRQSSENNVKLIWWYVAALDKEHNEDSKEKEELNFKAQFYNYEEALEKLTFQADRDMIKKAIEIVQASYTDLRLLTLSDALARGENVETR